jgi:hypothetical protein
LLPTPSATSYGSNQSPSPGARIRPSLETMARNGLFPTPDASNRGARKDPENSGHQINLVDIVGSRKLNPGFVEWLMGYPIGWTDLVASETQSSRKSRKKSSAP